MQEIVIKDNELGLKIFINGVPDVNKIPKEIVDNFISTLERKISSAKEREYMLFSGDLQTKDNVLK